MFEVIRNQILTPDQTATLHANTAAVLSSGMANRYLTAYRAIILDHAKGTFEGEPILSESERQMFTDEEMAIITDTTENQQALYAETPFVITLEPRSGTAGEDWACLALAKVDTKFGSTVPESDLALGLISRAAETIETAFEFTEADVLLAVRLARQQAGVDLHYVKHGQLDAVNWLISS